MCWELSGRDPGTELGRPTFLDTLPSETGRSPWAATHPDPPQPPFKAALSPAVTPQGRRT